MEKHNQYILYKLDNEIQSSISRLIVLYYKDKKEFEMELSSYIQKNYNANIQWSRSQELDSYFREEDKTSKSFPYKDYRIKALTVNNFRKFPQTRIPCGLTMHKEEEPKSLILLGGNGVGKTSLYAALEYVLEGTISEAKLRNSDIEAFATHSNSIPNTDSHKITIYTKDQGVFQQHHTFKEHMGDVSINTFFCSEWDIISIGQRKFQEGDPKETYLHDFFVENMGMGDLTKLKQTLDVLKKTTTDDLLKIAKLESHEDKIAALNKEKEEELKRLTAFYNLNSADKRTLLFYKASLDTKIKEAISKKDKLSFHMSELNNILDEQSAINLKDAYLSDIKDVVSFVSGIQEEMELYQKDFQYKGLNNEDLIGELKRDLLILNNITKTEESLDSKSESASRLKSIAAQKLFLSDPTAYFKEKADLSKVLEQCQTIIYQTQNRIKTFETEKVIVYKQDDFNLLCQISIALDKEQRAETEYSNQTKQTEKSNQLRNEIITYKKALSNHLDLETEKVFSIIKDTITKVMKHFISPEEQGSETILIGHAGKKISVQIQYKEYYKDLNNKEKEPLITPKKYYNTFRYKLFCMMLKISMAMATMKLYNINFPIILDDVFYASDYYNRELISVFIEELNDSYQNVFPDKKMQLICFTHDDLVLDAIRTAMEDNNKMDDVIFGRLFDYKTVLKDPYFGLEAVENGESYCNLYFELFK